MVASNRGVAPATDATVEVRGRNLKAELEALKEFDPKLARAVRRELRNTGKRVIGYMQAEIDKPPRGLVTGVKKETRYTTRRSSLRRSGVEITRRQFVTEVEASGARGRSRGSRDEQIKPRLAVAIMTGERRSGIRFRGPAPKGFAGAYNRPRWRHPVFGTGEWVEQAGRPYFGKVVTERREELARAVLDALDDALSQMNQGG